MIITAKTNNNRIGKKFSLILFIKLPGINATFGYR